MKYKEHISQTKYSKIYICEYAAKQYAMLSRRTGQQRILTGWCTMYGVFTGITILFESYQIFKLDLKESAKGQKIIINLSASVAA